MCQQPICKCGFDSCLNGGFFLASSCVCICPSQYTGIRCDSLITTTTTLATTTKKCALQLPCMNGAVQDPITCNCKCNNSFFCLNLRFKYKIDDIIIGYPAYTGTFCETVVCQNEPIECKDPKVYTINDCALNNLISYYCPVLCGKCQTTTPKPCVTLNCVNGGKFNPSSCLCECN